VLALNQMLAELAGARHISSPVDFIVPAADAAFVDSLLVREQLKEFVVINPGGGWPTKRWLRKVRTAGERIQEDCGFLWRYDRSR